MIQRPYVPITLMCLLSLWATVVHANQHIHAILGRSLLFNPQANNLPIIAVTIQYVTPAEMAEDNNDLPPFRRVIPVETAYIPFLRRNSTLHMSITRDNQGNIRIRSAGHPPQERHYVIASNPPQNARAEHPEIINLVQAEGTIWANEWSSSSESPSDSPRSPSPSEDPSLRSIFASLAITSNGQATNNQPVEAQPEHLSNGLHQNGLTRNGLNQQQ